MLTKLRCWWLLVAAVVTLSCLTNVAVASTITFGGKITQSVPDGTGPAVNNSTLNNIQDFQDYLVTLVFPGSLPTQGTYNLTGSSLTFSDPSPTPQASEAGFGSISLTITLKGAYDEFSLLGCLTSDSTCSDQLDANFKVLDSMLYSQNVLAIGLDQPHPLDLLEDGGTTDIQGTITTYSYASANAVPEPSSLYLLCCALVLALGWKGFRSSARSRRTSAD